MYCSESSEEENDDDLNRCCDDCKTSDTFRKTCTDNDSRIMFEKSGQTVRDVLEMVAAYCIRFGSSHEARKSLLEILKICAGPAFEDLSISDYKFSEVFDPPCDKIKFHFYCNNCGDKVLFSSTKKEIKNQKFFCDACNIEQCVCLSNPNFFVTVDLEYQVRLLIENEELAKFFNPCSIDFFMNNVSETNILKDVQDSELHKKMFQSSSDSVSYTMSTDGAPLFNMSKRSFWPLQIIFNNLPSHLRFKYVLLVGVMVVKSDPSPNLINLFIDAFWKEASHLYYEGMKIKFENVNDEILLHLKPISVVADSSARPVLQNRIKYSGYFSCSYCYHEGKYINRAVKYPFLENESEMRTHDSHMLDIQKSKEKKCSFRGVKGESKFCEIPTIDMVWGFPLDYMHNALLGMAESTCDDWYKILKPAQRKKIDEYLSEIQFPRDLQRSTEPFTTRSIWKANHWKSWLLYCSLPICSEFIPDELLEHFALYVNSIFTLLKLEITEDELKTCEKDLLTFVSQLDNFYGENRSTYNAHSSEHLPESSKKSGPMWATSAFPFENNIHKLKERINGTKSVEQQLTKKSLIALKYSLRQPEANISENAANYCKNIFSSKMCTKSAVTAKNVTFFGANPKNIFESKIDKEFERCIYNKIVYSSVQYTRSKKWNDSVIYLKNGNFVQIKAIYLRPDKTCFFDVQKLIVQPFYAGNIPVTHIWEIVKNTAHAPVLLNEISSKAVVLQFNNKSFVCRIPNSIEVQ